MTSQQQKTDKMTKGLFYMFLIISIVFISTTIYFNILMEDYEDVIASDISGFTSDLVSFIQGFLLMMGLIFLVFTIIVIELGRDQNEP